MSEEREWKPEPVPGAPGKGRWITRTTQNAAETGLAADRAAVKTSVAGSGIGSMGDSGDDMPKQADYPDLKAFGEAMRKYRTKRQPAPKPTPQ